MLLGQELFGKLFVGLASAPSPRETRRTHHARFEGSQANVVQTFDDDPSALAILVDHLDDFRLRRFSALPSPRPDHDRGAQGGVLVNLDDACQKVARRRDEPDPQPVMA